MLWRAGRAVKKNIYIYILHHFFSFHGEDTTIMGACLV